MNASEGILRSMDVLLDDKKALLIKEGQQLALKIKEDVQKQIDELRAKAPMKEQVNTRIANVEKQLQTEKQDWILQFNKKRSSLISLIFSDALERIIKAKNLPVYEESLYSLYQEVISEIGDSPALIHITKGYTHVLTGRIPAKYEIKDDLSENGVVIEQLDVSVSIINTIESRLEAKREELEISINNAFFKELEVLPWESSVLDTITPDFMD